MDDKSRGDEEIEFRYYVVGLVDVLGQEAELEKLSAIPRASDKEKQYIEAVRRTWGVVYLLRESFRGYYKTQKGPKDQARYETLTQDGKAEYERLMDVDFGMQQFSDTVVSYSPLRNRHGELTTRGVYGITCACANMMMVNLAKGIPLRGAVEIGVAAELASGEIYGPALSHAYNLECQVAQYPRIVVGPEFIRYLSKLILDAEETNQGKFNKAMAQFCLDLLRIDDDGSMLVDFLGPRMRELVGEGHRDLVKKGLQFVSSEHERFRREGDRKLALRYSLLRGYYLFRAQDWGVEP